MFISKWRWKWVIDIRNCKWSRISILDFEINELKRQLIITYSNVKSLSVNFFTMNTEVLFSERPFVGLNEKNENKNENEMFSYIWANSIIKWSTIKW